MTALQDHPPATTLTTPRVQSPAGPISLTDQVVGDAQDETVGEGHLERDTGHSDPDAHGLGAGVAQLPARSHQVVDAQPHTAAGGDQSVLLDPILALAAATLDDLERVRIATENRARSLVQVYGLTGAPQHTAAVELTTAIAAVEHAATLTLQRALRTHPLGPWVKATVGIGEKQGARLLAAIGDPFWNSLHDRPRTVSELWAFCGYHVLPASQSSADTHTSRAGGGTNNRTDQISSDAPADVVGAVFTPGGGNTDQARTDAPRPSVGVAATRSRGSKANWSPDAKMRAHLIAESCMKQAASPYRATYDTGRAKYADAPHAVDCRRCGPAGKPAQAGSPLSAGHQHARALRLVAKAILRDLWRESKRLHEHPAASQQQRDTHVVTAGGGA